MLTKAERKEKFFAKADAGGGRINVFRFYSHPKLSISYWKRDGEKSSQHMKAVFSDIKRDLKEIKEKLRDIGAFIQKMGRLKLTPAQAYAALEMAPDASDIDVKKAYRRLAKKWHPDKWGSAPKNEMEAAQEKFKALGLAYETVKKMRGMN